MPPGIQPFCHDTCFVIAFPITFKIYSRFNGLNPLLGVILQQKKDKQSAY